jgi:hypothetical protein
MLHIVYMYLYIVYTVQYNRARVQPVYKSCIFCCISLWCLHGERISQFTKAAYFAEYLYGVSSTVYLGENQPVKKAAHLNVYTWASLLMLLGQWAHHRSLQTVYKSCIFCWISLWCLTYNWERISRFTKAAYLTVYHLGQPAYVAWAVDPLHKCADSLQRLHVLLNISLVSPVYLGENQPVYKSCLFECVYLGQPAYVARAVDPPQKFADSLHKLHILLNISTVS